MRTDTPLTSILTRRVYLPVVLSYEQLTEQNRTLAALLAAERDRVRAEREKREVAEEQHALAARLLEELRKSYAIL